MFAKLTTSLAVLLAGTLAALADPVGSYSIRGTNPGGGSSYSGSVEVTRTGETYRVVWVIGGETYTGTGIGDDSFLAVSYRSGNQTGLALYGRKPDRSWEGVWAYAGGRQLGTDRWTPR